MQINKHLLAPCGLYCGVCGVYVATRDSNAGFMERLLGVYRSQIPGLDKLTVKDLECDGCLSERKSYFCQHCSIRECTKSRQYDGCHQCSEFPCDHIDKFPVPVGKKVMLRAIPFRRENGTEKWVRDEEARYTCPACGNRLFRGAKRCNKCKLQVDQD